MAWSDAARAAAAEARRRHRSRTIGIITRGAKKGTALGHEVRTQAARDIRGISKATGRSKFYVANSMAEARLNQIDYNNAMRAKLRGK